jgi:uncharacterized protein YoaH (UPF0181 family)
MSHIPVSQQEVENIKLLLSKGLSTAEICKITGRSDITVRRIAKGQMDNRFNSQPKNDELRELITQVFDLLAKIEERLGDCHD